MILAALTGAKAFASRNLPAVAADGLHRRAVPPSPVRQDARSPAPHAAQAAAKAAAVSAQAADFRVAWFEKPFIVAL